MFGKRGLERFHILINAAHFAFGVGRALDHQRQEQPADGKALHRRLAGSEGFGGGEGQLPGEQAQQAVRARLSGIDALEAHKGDVGLHLGPCAGHHLAPRRYAARFFSADALLAADEHVALAHGVAGLDRRLAALGVD